MTDPSPDSTGPVVLIVDDDPSVCRGLARLLRSNGLQAVTCASACALLESETWRKASCFLIDVRMPQMSGFELARRLAAAGSQAPVILMSGHVDGADPEVTAAGPLAFLPKPVDERSLMDALRRAFGARLDG